MNLMCEVEQEISRILNKNNRNETQKDEFCNEDNLEKCLQHVMQEFDYFDVCHMSEPFNLSSASSLKSVLIQLVNSSYSFIKLHRDTKKRQNDDFEKHSRTSSDVQLLTQTVDTLRKDVASKDTQLRINKEKVLLEKLENEALKNKVSIAKKEIMSLKKENAAENLRHKHELQKVLAEGKRLENRFRHDCSGYISKEGHIVSVIDGLKKNEQKNLEMIAKLQKNNHELLEEILVLKGELAEVLYKNSAE